MSCESLWLRRVQRTAVATFAPALLFAAVPMASAQQTAPSKYTRDVPADLARKVKISEDSAHALAAALVANGALKALELEREDGKLLYSMEFTVPGTPGVEEVNIDAVTGELIGKEHETPSREG